MYDAESAAWGRGNGRIQGPTDLHYSTLTVLREAPCGAGSYEYHTRLTGTFIANSIGVETSRSTAKAEPTRMTVGKFFDRLPARILLCMISSIIELVGAFSDDFDKSETRHDRM